MVAYPSSANGITKTPKKKAAVNAKFPLPQASSTPKRKFSNHSQLNGNGHLNNISLQHLNGGDSPKRRKTVHMESDDEGAKVEPTGHGSAVNGAVNGHGLSKGKSHKSKDSPEALQNHRKQLPIAQGIIWLRDRRADYQINYFFATGRDALINEIRSNDTVVLLGETGSGKTTRKCNLYL